MSPLIKPTCLLGVAYFAWGLVLELIELNPPNFVAASALVAWGALFGWAAYLFFEAWLR